MLDVGSLLSRLWFFFDYADFSWVFAYAVIFWWAEFGEKVEAVFVF